MAEEVDSRTKRQAVKELHERRAKERAEEASAVKAHYTQIKDSPAIADLLVFTQRMAAYHLKIAKDGVGAKLVGKNEDGQNVYEDYYLTQEQRVAELDQAKGIETIQSYLEQKIA